MEKSEILKEISELSTILNDSIYQRGGKNKIVYDNYVSDFLYHQLNQQDFLEWSEDLAVSASELNEIIEYMSSSSYISAWYHLSGNKAKRDKAAHSCSTLISGLGKDPEPVMLKYLEFESFWRRVLKNEGIAPKNLRLWGLFLVMVVIIALIILLS